MFSRVNIFFILFPYIIYSLLEYSCIFSLKLTAKFEIFLSKKKYLKINGKQQLCTNTTLWNSFQPQRERTVRGRFKTKLPRKISTDCVPVATKQSLVSPVRVPVQSWAVTSYMSRRFLTVVKIVTINGIAF